MLERMDRRNQLISTLVNISCDFFSIPWSRLKIQFHSENTKQNTTKSNKTVINKTKRRQNGDENNDKGIYTYIFRYMYRKKASQATRHIQLGFQVESKWLGAK